MPRQTPPLPRQGSASAPALAATLLLLVACAALAGCDEGEDIRPCAVDRDGPDFEAVETRCDGLDNDCDGRTDVLLPLPENACTGDGACTDGVATCQGGARVCLTRPPVAETFDGVDNDCDGSTDEGVAAAVALPGLARVAIPPYVFEKDEDPRLAGLMRGVFDQSGIPYEAVAPDAKVPKLDWGEALRDLSRYRLLIIPGYVLPSFLDEEQLAGLDAWVKQGGVLVWTKPVGDDDSDGAKAKTWSEKILAFGGVARHTKVMSASGVRLNGKGAATLWLDAAQERSLTLTDKPTDPASQVEVFTFDPLPGTEVLATAVSGGKALGATWLRRKHGAGAVYTLGFDPVSYTQQLCYVNCFDPGIDVAVMFYKGAWREASQGHYVIKHTAPGTEPGVLMVSHDIDAPDSHNNGNWGLAGAIRMAEMEQQQGVRGAFFVTTDYVTKYYNAAMVKRLCQLGMCPEGGHSVQHKYWGDFKHGFEGGFSQDKCDVTRKTYNPRDPTVCGEIAVNLQQLRNDMPQGTRLEAWRTPYLESNPHQYKALAALGIRFDSSLATGDLRTNFPVDLPRYAYYNLEDTSAIDEMWVFPVNLEDGIGWYEQGKEQRRELTPKWWSEFQNRWNEQLMGNAGNGAWSVQLVHPSYGIGAGPDNLTTKIDAVRWTIERGKELGLHIAPLYELADFWLGRHAAKLVDVAYADGAYTGKIVVGAVPARRFSLEFGDRIASVQHNTSSGVVIDGRRVVFELILPAGSVVSFTAKVDAAAQGAGGQP